MLYSRFLDLELAPRGNYRTEEAFPTRVISEHTIPTGSAVASRLLRSGAMGAVATLATASRCYGLQVQVIVRA